MKTIWRAMVIGAMFFSGLPPIAETYRDRSVEMRPVAQLDLPEDADIVLSKRRLRLGEDKRSLELLNHQHFIVKGSDRYHIILW